MTRLVDALPNSGRLCLLLPFGTAILNLIEELFTLCWLCWSLVGAEPRSIKACWLICPRDFPWWSVYSLPLNSPAICFGVSRSCTSVGVCPFYILNARCFESIARCSCRFRGSCWKKCIYQGSSSSSHGQTTAETKTGRWCPRRFLWCPWV